jgi:hypothetical protein
MAAWDGISGAVVVTPNAPVQARPEAVACNDGLEG